MGQLGAVWYRTALVRITSFCSKCFLFLQRVSLHLLAFGSRNLRKKMKMHQHFQVPVYLKFATIPLAQIRHTVKFKCGGALSKGVETEKHEKVGPFLQISLPQ